MSSSAPTPPTDLRDRLFDRCGVPRDCGWTDDQLLELLDLGLRTNSPTEPADDSPAARYKAQAADLGWALNCHSLDAFVGMPTDVLAGLLLDVVHGLARTHLTLSIRQGSTSERNG